MVKITSLCSINEITVFTIITLKISSFLSPCLKRHRKMLVYHYYQENKAATQHSAINIFLIAIFTKLSFIGESLTRFENQIQKIIFKSRNMWPD